MLRKYRGRMLSGLVAVLVLALAGVASAAVTFNAADGKGFVGKGDVQTAFGWNNKQLQDNAQNVTFTYNSSVTYAQDCYKIVGGTRNEQRVEVTFRKSQVVNATVGSQGRDTSSGLNGPNTGFILTGYGASTGDTSAPESICNPADSGDNSEDRNGFLPDGDVEQIASSGGLYVNHGGISVLLPQTPAAV